MIAGNMKTGLAFRDDAFLFDTLSIRPGPNIRRAIDIVIAAMLYRVFFARIIIYMIILTAFVHDTFGILAVHVNRIWDITCIIAVSAMLCVGRNIDTGIGTKCIRGAAFTRTLVTQLPIVARIACVSATFCRICHTGIIAEMIVFDAGTNNTFTSFCLAVCGFDGV